MRKPKKRALSWVLSIVFVLAAFAAPFTAGTSEGDSSRFDSDQPHGEHFCCAEHSGETECDQSCFDLDRSHGEHFCCAEHIAEVEGDEKDDTRYTPPDIDPGCGCLLSNAGTYTTNTNGGNVNIRAGHSTQSTKIGSIPYGSTFIVSVASGSWAHVNYNGINGFVSMSVIKKVGEAPNPWCDCSPTNSGTYTTNTVSGNVNIRAGHSTQSNKIGSIPRGSTFRVSAASGSWAHVNYNGVKGYVSMSVIKRVPNPTPEPPEFSDYITTQLAPGSSTTIIVNNYSASELNWTLSNTRVASVNPQTGKVTANACGKVTLTVSLIGNSSVSASTTLTVNPSTKETEDTPGRTLGGVYMIKNPGRNKYLSVADSGVALANKNEMDGRQLWYVEWTGNGYKLYSMGHKDVASSGASESLLRGCAENKTPGFGSETADYLTWSIHKHTNGYYYLTNTGKNYKNTSVSAKSSGNTVSCIDLANESDYARWVFEKIDTATFNNYYDGGYDDVTVDANNPLYVKVNVNWDTVNNRIINSCTDGDTPIYSAHNFLILDGENNPWNGLANVVIFGPNNQVPAGINPIIINIICEDLGKYGPAAIMLPLNDEYKEMENASFLPKKWYGATIKLSTNYNEDEAADLTDLYIEKLILHELGHALKLAHPKENDYLMAVPRGRGGYAQSNALTSPPICSIMNQGSPVYNPQAPEDSAYICATPKWHDIINLINKWGRKEQTP